jgi:hypothetical protein
MQIIVNDHTNYMVRARSKCKIDGRPPGTGLSASMEGFTNSYMNTGMWGITRDG